MALLSVVWRWGLWRSSSVRGGLVCVTPLLYVVVGSVALLSCVWCWVLGHSLPVWSWVLCHFSPVYCGWFCDRPLLCVLVSSVPSSPVYGCGVFVTPLLSGGGVCVTPQKIILGYTVYDFYIFTFREGMVVCFGKPGIFY